MAENMKEKGSVENGDLNLNQIKKSIQELEAAPNGEVKEKIKIKLSFDIRNTPVESLKELYDILTVEYLKKTDENRSYLDWRRKVMVKLPADKALNLVEKLSVKEPELAWADLESLRNNWRAKGDDFKGSIQKATGLMDKLMDKLGKEKAA